MTHPFLRGREYSREHDIHGVYGGQRQSGIVTPAESPFIFLFTGSSGTAYGYEDGWASDGTFMYTGEGQVGDMAFVRGNKAIRDHAPNGKELLLFETLGKGKAVRFQGAFACASWEHRPGKDRDGNDRQIIVFHLVPEAVEEGPEAEVRYSPTHDIGALRSAAYEASQAAAATGERSAREEYRKRSAAVRDYVLARAGGACEGCNENAPFIRGNGTPYLEPHHLLRLADDGPDDPRYVSGLCPNCHRRCHHGEDGAQFNEMLLNRIWELEGEI